MTNKIVCFIKGENKEYFSQNQQFSLQPLFHFRKLSTHEKNKYHRHDP